MADARITYLFHRYISGACTPAEKQELAVLGLMPENQAVLDALLAEHWEQTGLSEAMPEEKGRAILAAILGPAVPAEKPKPAMILLLHWKKLAVAASIVLVIGLSGYFLFFNKPGRPAEVVKTEPAPDVEAPKITKATIMLADGRRVYLDSAGEGQLASQGDVKLVKLADGRISYEPAGNSPGPVIYNTLTNPRGSKVINMQLSDGSHVWLNAGSSVTYPVAFTGNERKITMTGEAYFEVAHDDGRPFFVSKGEMEVQVLGTHFNVNAYDDEQGIKVTLLEGSVKVSASSDSQPDRYRVLKPGQQAEIINNRLSIINDPDLEQTIAWKNGWFEFDQVELPVIMRQVSRWYDLDIVYEGRTGHEKFGGRVSRELPLSGVVKMMESNGVAFKLEGKVLKVIP